MAAFKMNDKSIRWILENNAILAGKKVIGRGVFCAVFDDGPEHVLKLTADTTAYAMMADSAYRIEGQHFTRVSRNYGEVGECKIGPVYLVQVEKLAELRPKTDVRKLALKLKKGVYRTSLDRKIPYDDASAVLTAMAEQDAYPDSIRHALGRLANFAGHFKFTSLDMHMKNFMVRPDTGDMVFSDPFVNDSLLSEIYG